MSDDLAEVPDKNTEIFKYWKNPEPASIGRSLLEFLDVMAQATHIHITGEDTSRCRVVVTLLHGNEPSGLAGLYHLLQNRVVPAVDIHCFIPGVKTALAGPGFFHRSLPGVRDLNRCFNGPYDDEAGTIAAALLASIKQLQPEAVLDIHNTSGSGPAFGVTTFMDKKHDALVSLFTHRVIVTDLKLGALMEISETLCPTVTIETGGVQDNEAMQLALEGLEKYLTRQDVLTPPPADFALEYFSNPHRLELRDKATARLDFGNQPANQGGLTLRPDIERFNFGQITPEQSLGFINESDLVVLSAKNAQGEEKLFDFFQARDGKLYPTQVLKLFMVTSNPSIARSDCLFYLVPVSESLSRV